MKFCPGLSQQYSSWLQRMMVEITWEYSLPLSNVWWWRCTLAIVSVDWIEFTLRMIQRNRLWQVLTSHLDMWYSDVHSILTHLCKCYIIFILAPSASYLFLIFLLFSYKLPSPVHFFCSSSKMRWFCQKQDMSLLFGKTLNYFLTTYFYW